MTVPDDPRGQPQWGQPHPDQPQWGQQQWGQPQWQGYGPPPYGGYPAYGPQQTSGRAIAVLVCAIGSFVLLPLVLAVVALVLAPGAQREIAYAGGRLGGQGLVTAGRVLAWINLALSLVVVVLIVLGIALAVSSGSSGVSGNA